MNERPLGVRRPDAALLSMGLINTKAAALKADAELE